MANIILQPSPGHLLILPHKKDKEVAGITFAVRDTNLPMGRVVEVGLRPKGYRSLPVKRDDIVYFSVHTAQEVDVFIDGVQETCRFITYADLRGKQSKNESSIIEKGRAVLDLLKSRAAVFGAGFLLGSVSAPYLEPIARASRGLWQKIKSPFGGGRPDRAAGGDGLGN